MIEGRATGHPEQREMARLYERRSISRERLLGCGLLALAVGLYPGLVGHNFYFTYSACRVVLHKSIPAQILQIVLYYYLYQK